MTTERRKVLVTAVDAAYYIQRTYHITIKPATIWQWARRRHITVYRGGGVRYDLREIEEHARNRGLLDKRGK